jgi:long-chain acyl-CoA synthetase
MKSPDPFRPFACLAKNAARFPDRAAIITPNRRITHGDLADLVAGRAMSLLAQGLDPKLMTAVTLADEVEHLLMSLALLCLGTGNISFGSFEPPETRAGLAAVLKVTQVVTGGNAVPLPHLTHFSPPDGRLPRTVTEALDLMAAVCLQAQDRVLFSSTSGTTGLPKTFGVPMLLFLDMVDRIAEDPGRACVLRNSSVEFHSSRLHQLAVCLAGNTAAVLDPVMAGGLAAFCASAGVTEFQSGTYRLGSLLSGPLDRSQRLPDGLRILTGGSRVPGTLRQAVRERLTPNLWVNYATSEIGVVSVAGPDDHVPWPEGIGHPRPGVEVSLRGPDGSEVPRGQVGEAWIRKAGVEGWFRTGDLLIWPKSGPLVFQSRRDDMMIMNGINVFPGPIEDALMACQGVLEAVAFPVHSAVHGQIPVAAVVLEPGAKLEPADLLAHLRGVLGIRAPRQIRLLDAIPRTHLGKPRIVALTSDGS